MGGAEGRAAALPEGIFRRYDVRGTYGEDLTEGVAWAVGWALVGEAQEAGRGERPLVAVGRDARLSSPSLAAALAGGVEAAGGRALDLGMCPSPLVYFAAFRRPEVDAFVSVTGSHNPPGENGFKLGIGRSTLHSEGISSLRRRAEAAPPGPRPASAAPERLDIVSLYQDWAVEHFAPLREAASALGRPPVVAVDSGNGTAGPVLPPVLRALGFEVEELFSAPDGRFPNHHPDPTLPETLTALRAAVARRRADLGVAFDGDADRLGVVDEAGRVVYGDMLLLVLALDLVRRWKAMPGGPQGPPPLVISEVKASQVLYDRVRQEGGRALMWRTGHSLIKAKMAETGASLAGEMSGHLFFADRYFGFDDALYAALRLLELYVGRRLEGTASRFSDLLAGLPRVVNTPELRVPSTEEGKFGAVEAFRRAVEEHRRRGGEPTVREVIDVDGVRVVFPRGWGLLRASNTQPILVMRFEAQDEASLADYRSFFERLADGKGGAR